MTVLVKPGERIPVDGKIIEDSSEIDEAMINGKTMFVEKTIGVDKCKICWGSRKYFVVKDGKTIVGKYFRRPNRLN